MQNVSRPWKRGTGWGQIRPLRSFEVVLKVSSFPSEQRQKAKKQEGFADSTSEVISRLWPRAERTGGNQREFGQKAKWNLTSEVEMIVIPSSRGQLEAKGSLGRNLFLPGQFIHCLTLAFLVFILGGCGCRKRMEGTFFVFLRPGSSSFLRFTFYFFVTLQSSSTPTRELQRTKVLLEISTLGLAYS